MDTKISDIMIAQHALIGTLFVAFKDELKTGQDTAQSFFSELIWEVKKHFFVEEQAIFNLLPWNNPEIYEVIKKLKHEHTIMQDELEKISKDLQLFDDKKPGGFSAVMDGHLIIEEKKLYPTLDEKLTDQEKEHIIYRINQIPLEQH